MTTLRHVWYPVFLLLLLALVSACNNATVTGAASQNHTLIPAGNTCTNQSGGTITVNVPAAGKVVVNAQVMLGLKSHTAGTIDMAMVHVGATATDCTLENMLEGYNQMGYSIPKDEPSWTATVVRLIPISVSRTFTVSSAGSKTFYLNARRVAGTSDVSFWESSMQAVYYPD